MEDFWQFVGGYWWLVFPLAGITGGWFKGVQKWDERRRRDKLEMYRLKYGAQHSAATPPHAPDQPAAPAQVRTREIERVLADHDEVNRRWLAYELDVAKLIDYPVMTDMREQVTADFHRAKRNADGLRPDDTEELRDPDALSRYRDAVRDYQLAFDIAEREARRRRTSDFSETERASLNRAKQLLALADDTGATQAERQSAYRRATRELEGLIALPEATTGALEQRIAGALPSRPQVDRPERPTA
ncbi:hypothetical protein LQF12_16000 [Ruania suaedae]|uniref:hypothetical protein n=1 Tax=Ruania suaedae TaxID=2897774 RepID=UPI001E2CE812|nr:hypothetical protein [Ruania suaedae]UFU02964.1 hypothetical protein LQF12_16000 [Ruania suaedae]